MLSLLPPSGATLAITERGGVSASFAIAQVLRESLSVAGEDGESRDRIQNKQNKPLLRCVLVSLGADSPALWSRLLRISGGLDLRHEMRVKKSLIVVDGQTDLFLKSSLLCERKEDNGAAENEEQWLENGIANGRIKLPGVGNGQQQSENSTYSGRRLLSSWHSIVSAVEGSLLARFPVAPGGVEESGFGGVTVILDGLHSLLCAGLTTAELVQLVQRLTRFCITCRGPCSGQSEPNIMVHNGVRLVVRVNSDTSWALGGSGADGSHDADIAVSHAQLRDPPLLSPLCVRLAHGAHTHADVRALTSGYSREVDGQMIVTRFPHWPCGALRGHVSRSTQAFLFKLSESEGLLTATNLKLV